MLKIYFVNDTKFVIRNRKIESRLDTSFSLCEATGKILIEWKNHIK